MNEIIALIPQEYRNAVLFVLLASPYVTRAVYSLMNGRGLRGTFSAIWFGTNQPADKIKL
jgi:hypothetical protein